MLEVTPFICGRIVSSAANFLSGRTGKLDVPVLAFLIQHPKGNVLFDTGLHKNINQDISSVPEIARQYEIRIESNGTLLEQIKSLQIDPKSINLIISSHLHFDHIGGNSDFPNARILIQKREWETIKEKCSEFLRGYYDTGQEYLLLDGEHDVFKDGSIKCLPTYGHTKGHQSLLVSTEKDRYLLASDCCYRKETLTEDLLPPSAWDHGEMRKSLERIRNLRNDGIQIIAGHDDRCIHGKSLVGI